MKDQVWKEFLEQTEKNHVWEDFLSYYKKKYPEDYLNRIIDSSKSGRELVDDLYKIEA